MSDTATVPVETPGFFENFGEKLKAPVELLQDYSLMALDAVKIMFTTTRWKADLVDQMDLIGVGSLPIICVALACVGGVIVLNAASQFERFGEKALTGDALSLSLLRELGPVFTALLVCGRNATGRRRSSARCWSPSKWMRCAGWASIRFGNWSRRACSPPCW